MGRVRAAVAAGYSNETFVSEETDWFEGESYLRRVLQGRVVNAWTAREMTIEQAKNARILIVKFVHANRLLPWICRSLNIRHAIMLIRHPCAVVASQLKSETWRSVSRPTAPPFIDGIYADALAETNSVEEFLAATWVFDQLPALIHQPPRPWLIVTYEELSLRPEESLMRVFSFLNKSVDMGEAMARLRQPSSTVYESGISGIGGWQRQLSDDQSSAVLNIVRKFGIDFYDESVEPDYDSLHSEDLPSRLIAAGKKPV